MSLSKTTQDHDEIRKWAEARGAKPAAVAQTERKGKTGILRLEFPGSPNAEDDSLEEISWEEFFRKFDESGLEFVYQEETSGGEKSNFNKLVYPEHAAHGKHSESHSGSKKSASKSSSHSSSSRKKSAA